MAVISKQSQKDTQNICESDTNERTKKYIEAQKQSKKKIRKVH